MIIDYSLRSGPRGGLSFDFVPGHDAIYDIEAYARALAGSDAFNTTESAYILIEKTVREESPEYGPYSRYGVTHIPSETWFRILERLQEMAAEIYAGNSSSLGKTDAFARDKVLIFLSAFIQRMRELAARYPFIVIGGI